MSSLELIQLHLARISRFNSQLNAIVTLDDSGAKQRARQVDEARAGGSSDPLLGLPLTIKDSIDVYGLPTTGGVPSRAGHLAVRDAPVVSRLRRAGGVIVGKTNVAYMTGDWQTDNPLFGRTNNPWDATRTPGGSTGGGAAAVAAGMSPLEWGSDIGGSIRIPAAFCGVYGHRPSETLIPRSGQFPGSPLPNQAAVLNVIGPLARSAADLELALQVTAGADADEEPWTIRLPPARAERLAKFRVAVLPSLSWQPVGASVLEAMERVVSAVRTAGALVAEASPDELGDMGDHHRLYLRLIAAIFGFNAGRSEEARGREAAALLSSDDEFDLARVDGLLGSAHDLLAWHAERETVRAVWREFFQHWDVLLSPITLIPAFPHAPGASTIDVDGKEVPYMRQLVFPGIATLAGLPATVFPAGRDARGLPVGLQAVGPYLDDLTPIRFVSALAGEIGGYEPVPGFDSPLE